jgi:hypothetical protein
MLSQSIFRGSLRSLVLPCGHQNYPLVQQPLPLISLRSFSAKPRLTSVLLPARGFGAPEKSGASLSSFEQLGLGDELLSFLSEHNLQTPTEIQAFFYALLLS